MQGDLISRSKLINQLSTVCGNIGLILPEQVWDIITAQPTAYDVEKVVKQLEKASRIMQPVIPTKEAIDIVRGGEEMKRLTKRLHDGKALCIEACEKKCTEGHYECHKCKPFTEVLKKLADYEDAEDKSLLLMLPVAIGNIVYRVNEYADNPIIPMGVTSIEIEGITDAFKKFKCKECVFGGEFTYRFTDIGKTVFFKRAEAEQALADMKKG